MSPFYLILELCQLNFHPTLLCYLFFKPLYPCFELSCQGGIFLSCLSFLGGMLTHNCHLHDVICILDILHLAFVFHFSFFFFPPCSVWQGLCLIFFSLYYFECWRFIHMVSYLLKYRVREKEITEAWLADSFDFSLQSLPYKYCTSKPVFLLWVSKMLCIWDQRPEFTALNS